MPRFDEPLDLFSSGNSGVQIEHLYRLRRSTHRAILRFGEAYGQKVNACSAGCTLPRRSPGPPHRTKPRRWQPTRPPGSLARTCTGSMKQQRQPVGCENPVLGADLRFSLPFYAAGVYSLIMPLRTS